MDILKTDLLADIQQRIDYCDQKIGQNPFEEANKRVLYLAENPCLTGKFYLNAVYNETQNAQNDDLEQRKKYQYPVTGEVSIQNNKNFSFRVQIDEFITTKTFQKISQEAPWVQIKEKEPQVSKNTTLSTFTTFEEASIYYKKFVSEWEEEEKEPYYQYYSDYLGRQRTKLVWHKFQHKLEKHISIDAQNQIINFTKEKISEYEFKTHVGGLHNWNEAIFNDKLNVNQVVTESVDKNEWGYYNTIINIQTERNINDNRYNKSEEVLNYEDYQQIVDTESVKEVKPYFIKSIYVDITSICENFMGNLKSTKDAKKYKNLKDLLDEFKNVVRPLFISDLENYTKDYKKFTDNVLLGTDKDYIETMKESFFELIDNLEYYKQYMKPGGNLIACLNKKKEIKQAKKTADEVNEQSLNTLLNKRSQLAQAKREKNIVKEQKLKKEITDIENNLFVVNNNANSNNIFDLTNLNKTQEEELNYIETTLTKACEEAYKQAASTSSFNANDIKINITVNFIPSYVTEYFDFQNLDSSYVKKQLDEKMKKIIKEQNSEKQTLARLEKQSYIWNTQDKPKLEQAKQQLNKINQLIEQDKSSLEKINKAKYHDESDITQLLKLKAIQEQKLTKYAPRALTAEEQAKGVQTSQSDMKTKKNIETNITALEELILNTTDLIDEKYKLTSELKKLEEQKVQLEQSIHEIEDTYAHIEIEEIDNVETLYEIRDKKENQVKVLQLQLENLIELRRKQTQINQDLVTYSTNQLKVIYDENNPNNKQQYIDTINNPTIKQKYQEIYRLTEQGYTVNDWQMIKLINEIEAAGYSIYDVDNVIYNQTAWETAQNDYIDYMDQLNDPKKGYDATVEKLLKKQQQLKDIEAQIEKLEGQDIATNIEEDGDGVVVETGYTFSPNGLYKNLYIDTKPTNDWIDAKQQLQILLNKYASELPDTIKEPRASHLQATSDGNGGIKVVEEQQDTNCKCNWWIPLNIDLFGFDINILSFLGLNTSVYKTDENGDRIRDKDNNFKTEKRQIAVMDGYGFIDTGKTITLTYTGIPTLPGCSVLIPGVGLEYGAVLAGFYAATKPQNIILLSKYPYQNNLSNGKFFWMQMGAAADIAAVAMGGTNIQVSFKIYVKTPLPCGYPKKCGIMTAEERECNGVCGLKNFFKDTHDIDTLCIEDFDFGEYMTQYQDLKKIADTAYNSVKPIIRKTTAQILDTAMGAIGGVDAAAEILFALYEKNFGKAGQRAAQYLELKRNIALWVNNGASLAGNIWNITNALLEMDNVLDRLGSLITQIIPKVFTKEIMDLIPPECQKYFCQIERRRKQDSIKNLADNIHENTMISVDSMTNFLVKSFEDAGWNFINSVGGFLKGVGETSATLIGAAGTILQGMLGNFMNKFDFFSMTQYCPRRLSDTLKDINLLNDAPSNGIMSLGNGLFKVPDGINIFDQLGISVCQEMIGSIMSLLNNCVTRSITNHNIAYSKLFPEGTRKYLEAANSIGDIASMSKILKHNGLTLQNLFHEANRSSILSNFANIDTGNISLGYVYDNLDMRGITDIIDIDEILPVDQVDQVLQNTINKAISNNNENIEKLKKGEVLSLNDQFTQLVNEDYENKTEDWAKNLSDKVNAVTSVTSNVKGLLDNYNVTDPMKIVNNPIDVLNKLNNIQTTIMQEIMSAILNGKEAAQQEKAANGDSEQIQKIKVYIQQRTKYLEQLKNGKL